MARFKELAQLEQQAQFHVVYELDRHRGGEQGQFSWMQTQRQVRWDEVVAGDGQITGTSIVPSNNGSRTQCIWTASSDSTTAEVACVTGGTGGDYHDDLLTGFFSMPLSVSFVRYGTVMGIPTECYRVVSVGTAGVCLTSDGVPLAIDSSTVGFRYSLAAIDVRSAPTDADVHAPLGAGVADDMPHRTFPLDQLTLPSVPLIRAFLEGGS